MKCSGVKWFGVTGQPAVESHKISRMYMAAVMYQRGISVQQEKR